STTWPIRRASATSTRATRARSRAGRARWATRSARTSGPTSTTWSTAWRPARCPTRTARAASTQTGPTATPGSRSRVSPSSSRQALVTGIGGQDGGYLAEQLLAEGYEVWGMVRGPEGLARARAFPWLSGVHLIEGDLSDAASLQRVLEES